MNSFNNSIINTEAAFFHHASFDSSGLLF